MENPTVKVHHGQLRGICEKNVNQRSFIAFRGIPYAKPPVGNLRFKDCEPLESWSGVRDATRHGSHCAQQYWKTQKRDGSDDCLFLNVYTSTLNTAVPRAVMVWIHGGAFVGGSGNDDSYGPDYLIEHDIVLVTMNYRVGILGFLNVEDEEAPGNQGLKDQVQALRWIQQNITHFGGDPKNVTIFGESAGGAAVHFLTVSPLAKGLFHKAIIQSGVITNPWARVYDSPMETVKRLAAVLNKEISNVKDFVNYLRTLDVIELIDAEYKMQTLKERILFMHPFLPSIDSKAKSPFLTKLPEKAAKDGIKVPSICGYVSHEGIIIAGLMKEHIFNEIDADPENLLLHPILKEFLNIHNLTVEGIKKYYLDERSFSTENMDDIIQLYGDMNFIMGIHDIVEIQKKISSAPMYLYKFDYEVEDSALKTFLGPGLKGTCHGEELAFIFRNKTAEAAGKKPPATDTIEHHLIQVLTKLWTDFAKTGNPTPQVTKLIPIKWEPIDNSNMEYKCLEITDKLIMGRESNITKQLIQALNDNS